MTKLLDKLLISILVFWFIFFFIFTIILCFTLLFGLMNYIFTIPYKTLSYADKELIFYKVLLEDYLDWQIFSHKIDFETRIYPLIKDINDASVIREVIIEYRANRHRTVVIIGQIYGTSVLWVLCDMFSYLICQYLNAPDPAAVTAFSTLLNSYPPAASNWQTADLIRDLGTWLVVIPLNSCNWLLNNVLECYYPQLYIYKQAADRHDMFINILKNAIYG